MKITLDRLVAYLPPLVFVVLIPLANFFPNLLSGVDIHFLLAFMALAMVGIGVQLETKWKETTDSVKNLQGSIQRLIEVQTAYLERTKRPIMPSTFAEVFRQQAVTANRIGTLRVFAISSQQILSFLRFENLQVTECRLLLRAFDPQDQAHAGFANQILLAVRDWKRLASEGKIQQLKIRSYDFLPTEYQVIFDDHSMVAGLYESDPTDYSEVKVHSPLYVDGSTADGKAVIADYRERFDKLFEACDKHHGQNRYSDYCHPFPCQ